MTTAQREELLRQLTRAIRGGVDALKVLDHLRSMHPQCGLLQRELRVCQNRLHQVVEVVCHATSELADGLHLLRVTKLLLDSTMGCDVAGDRIDVSREWVHSGAPREDAVLAVATTIARFSKSVT